MLNNIYKADILRYGMGEGKSHATRFLYWFRTAQYTKSIIVRSFARLMLNHYRKKYGLEIPRQTKIGAGLYIGHAYNITMNENTVMGINCNIHKGVTIGQENRGRRKGVPTIGNCVWIGVNASIVGNITVGDDVLIAPNSYVNCGIPSHSIVFGTPCIIKERENATEGYINRKVNM